MNRAFLARLRAFVWRFQTLPFAERTFPTWAVPTLRERRFSGFHLTLDLNRSVTHRLLYLEGERVVPERTLIRSLVRPGQRVVDVGANIGYFMLLVRSVVGESGTILCLEPEPENRAELERTIERNALGNVSVLPDAAGASDGEASLIPGLNGVVRTDPGDGRLVIRMRRLDEVCVETVDFLKIDVEGFELSALQGAEKLFARDKPTVMIEIHPDLGSVREQIPEIVARLQRHHEVLAYRVCKQRGPLQKVAVRYLGASPLEELRDLERLKRECSANIQNEPFWLVGRPLL